MIEVDGVPHIVMEYVEGRRLAEVLATEGPLSPERAVEIALQVCDALEYAHTHGVTRRDIKPANILLTPSGGMKVSDFGIARIRAADSTQTLGALGMPSYMAPGQVRGKAHRRVWWLEIPEDTAARLERLAAPLRHP